MIKNGFRLKEVVDILYLKELTQVVVKNENYSLKYQLECCTQK